MFSAFGIYRRFDLKWAKPENAALQCIFRLSPFSNEIAITNKKAQNTCSGLKLIYKLWLNSDFV